VQRWKSVGQLNRRPGDDFNTHPGDITRNVELVKAYLPKGSYTPARDCRRVIVHDAGRDIPGHLLACSRRATAESSGRRRQHHRRRNVRRLGRTSGARLTSRRRRGTERGHAVRGSGCARRGVLNVALNAARTLCQKGGVAIHTSTGLKITRGGDRRTDSSRDWDCYVRIATRGKPDAA